MRSVFSGMRRGVALAVAMVLLTTAAAAATPRERERNKDRLIDRIVVWLQSRVSIPPG